MKQSTTSIFSTIILSAVFLIIIFSFLFSNYDNIANGGGSGGQEVASVDGSPISIREYQMALSRQIDFLKQMMGGNITDKQIMQMGIKETVLGTLVQQKHILNVGRDMGIAISTEEVKGEIKNLPYFKTNNQFDVNLYKNLLQNNGFTPTQFETVIKTDLISKKMEEILGSVQSSQSYAASISAFKNSILKVDAIKVARGDLTSFVQVTNDEVKQYVADTNNKKTIEELYNQNQDKYNKPEELKARHILLKLEDAKDDLKVKEKAEALLKTVTTKNFSEVAKKNTDDPSGKTDGGDLGWFARGKMVPEFEAAAFAAKKGSIVGPVKTSFGYHIILVEDMKSALHIPLEKVQDELAKMSLQKRKTKELDEVFKTTKTQLNEWLQKNSTKEINELKTKADAQWIPGGEINRLENNIGALNLNADEAAKIFKATPGEIVDLSNAGSITLVKVVGPEQKTTADLKTETQNQSAQFSREMREQLIKYMNAKSKVKTNTSLL